ncbi:hypothetical protein [uncultured Bilophila sp.]|uniref:hypothetical protein n=1 Tax=uncultured Bilophila sp. TaxID=529385 RepID=UPI00259789C5|nr:hypothetical protein [uncultured Bilophila sp.]
MATKNTKDVPAVQTSEAPGADASTENAQERPMTAPVSGSGTTSATVTVYCNMPNGISFRVPDGRKLTFAGYPVSRLVGAEGEALPAGRFGKTRDVARVDWEWIQKTYGKAPYFDAQNPLLFAAASEREGDAIARDFASTRHGMEQIDVWENGGRTEPYSSDDEKGS